MRDDYKAVFGDPAGRKDPTIIFLVDTKGEVTFAEDDRLGVIYNKITSKYFLAPGKGMTSSPFEAFAYSERVAKRRIAEDGARSELEFRPFPTGEAAAVGSNAKTEKEYLTVSVGDAYWGGDCATSVAPPAPAQSESERRKATPMFSGVLRYFPDALAAVARLSKAGNDKHNPGQPLHWAREKSKDHGDCLMRHQTTFDEIDPETGEYHAVAVLWRAAAQLQELEEKRLGKGRPAWQEAW